MLSELALAMGSLIHGLRPGCASGQDTGARGGSQDRFVFFLFF